jgi:hypothetical protein
MAANTGPNLNTYVIPEVELGDTFNVWRDTTNTQTFKLNKLRVYNGISSSSITLSVSDGGTLQAEIATSVGKAITFSQPVIFNSGVTFNGDVTFNAQTFTVNANNVTIDDYAIVLGETAGTSDSTIDTAGGGGLLLKRGGNPGNTAAWLWRSNSVQGLAGVWNSNAHIGLCGASAGLYPHVGGVLPVHGTGIRLDGNVNGAHGLQVDLANGTDINSIVRMSRYSPSGSTAFAEVLNGTTYGGRPFLNIKDGANRKTIRQSNHGFKFGTPVYLASDGTYAKARANNAETAEVVGIVSAEISAAEFEITFIGEIFGNFSAVMDQAPPLQTGKTYYLSPNNPGQITFEQPQAPGTVHKAVLIATGPQSAVVIPFTGGVLTTAMTISTTSSVAVRINQLNRFKIGDIVRFERAASAVRGHPSGVTLAYRLSNQLVQNKYTDGIYVLAQADSEGDATVAGMVIGKAGVVNGANYLNDSIANPNDRVWQEFDILMDGWFQGLSGLVPGTEYWLNTAVALRTQSTDPNIQPPNTQNCYENPNVVSYNQARPTQGVQVSKKLFMATSPVGGYLYSYRGDVNQAVSNTVVALENSLITDLRSSQQDDLKIGVWNNNSAGGYPAIRISPAPTSTIGAGSRIGNVGIGDPSWTRYNSGSAGNKILATLDVTGWMRVGETLAPSTAQGQSLIVLRDTSDASGVATPTSRMVIGVDRTHSNLVLGHHVKPSPSSNNVFLSTRSGQLDRSALVIGENGSVPSLTWKIADNSNVNLDSAVTMTDVLSIAGTNLAVDGNVLFVDGVNDRVGIGKTNPTVPLDVVGNIVASGSVTSGRALANYPTAPLNTLATVEYLRNVLPVCVQTHVTVPETYTHGVIGRAGARNISSLNTTITPKYSTNKVLVTYRLNYEVTSDGVFYLVRNIGGTLTEIGSHTGALGNRLGGLCSLDHDQQDGNTATNTTIVYLDTPNTTSPIIYELWWVSNVATRIFYLNRSISDTDTIAHERGTSSCILQEFFS